MGVRAVIVDIGGVLEDIPATGWIARWEKRLGLEPGGLAEIVSVIWQDGRIGRAPLADLENRTAAALSPDPAASQELWTDVWTEYLGMLNAELLDFFTDLRPHYKTGIMSNSFVGAREREQELYGFEDAFDLVMYSHEEGLEKPASRFYLLACERLGVDPRMSRSSWNFGERPPSTG